VVPPPTGRARPVIRSPRLPPASSRSEPTAVTWKDDGADEPCDRHARKHMICSPRRRNLQAGRHENIRQGDQDARALEHQSRCVTVTGRGHRARSAQCSVVRLSKGSCGIGQMEHSAAFGARRRSPVLCGGQRSGRLRVLPPPARGAPGVLLTRRPACCGATARTEADSVVGTARPTPGTASSSEAVMARQPPVTVTVRPSSDGGPGELGPATGR
jgi:hypothetical protein